MIEFNFAFKESGVCALGKTAQRKGPWTERYMENPEFTYNLFD